MPDMTPHQTITITRLYSLLSDKLGKESAESLTTFIEEKIKDEVGGATVDIATKDFVRGEVSNAKTEMVKWFVGIGLSTFVALALMIIGLYFKK